MVISEKLFIDICDFRIYYILYIGNIIIEGMHLVLFMLMHVKNINLY